MRAEFQGDGRIVVLGVAKALINSGSLVDETLRDEKFDLILLSITQEEVAGLKEFVKHPIEVEMDDIEIIYEYFMQRFGETSIPPAAYIKALDYADKSGTEVEGIDIPSGKYEDLFVEKVKLSDIIFLSLKKKRILKRKWTSTDAESFCVEWDDYVTRGGYRKVEDERATYMSSRIIEKQKKDTLAILEMEVFNQVVDLLNTQLQPGKSLQTGAEMRAVLSQ